MKTIEKVLIGLWIFVAALNLYFKNIPATLNAGVVVFVYCGYIREVQRSRMILDDWKKSIINLKKLKK